MTKLTDEQIKEKLLKGVSGLVMLSLYSVSSKRCAEVRRKFNIPYTRKKEFGRSY